MIRKLNLLRGAFAALAGFGFSLHAEGGGATRQCILFDRDWEFHLGDFGNDEERTWQRVNLPHDWMIAGVPGKKPEDMDGPFDKGSPASGSGAFLNGGVGWYHKTFTLPAEAKGKEITLLFEGAYMNADIWLNGQHLGTHPYGFTSFYYDITGGLKYGGEKNVLAVKLNVKQPSCRWYSGAGLYRDVWLIETAPVHVGVWGTYVTTPNVTADSAEARVRTTVDNDGGAARQVALTTTVLDPSGKKIGSATEEKKIDGKGHADFDQKIAIAKPRLWSLETPVLYKVVTQVADTGKVVDKTDTAFGVRTFEFTREKGFFLNGKHVEIQGVCNHHDLGALGSAVYPRALQRQLEIMKSMGCNAIRTSHNPPAPALLELCDKMGFLVMDEAFDEWKENKTTFGYGKFFDQWSEPDLVSMLDRDRNHPSIILWSIGNEIPEGYKGDPQGGPMGRRLVDICHREDPTRPVTSACPGPEKDWECGLAKALDVFGINYNVDFYPKTSPENRTHPSADPKVYAAQSPVVASETQSEIDARGEYGLKIDAQGKVRIDMGSRDRVSPYDGYWPGWANNPDFTYLALQRSPWMAGEFVWTGFDYLGEPTPHPWPSRSSYFGIVDLAGFPKDRYYQFKAHWTTAPMVHVMPHWTWPGFEGKEIPVWVFTNASSVELFLNGKSLGTKNYPADCEQMVVNPKNPAGTTPSLHLAWSVPYAPGELKAVAMKDGKRVATDIERTAGAPVRIIATADRCKIAAGDRDLSYIKVSIVDKDGNVCPDAEPELHFALSGDAATIAGLDDGDPINHEFFQGTQHKAFHGLALAILKSHGDATGNVTLTVSGDGLEAGTAKVRVVAGG